MKCFNCANYEKDIVFFETYNYYTYYALFLLLKNVIYVQVVF